MFLPVNGDPYRNNVVLHLPMTGANNSTTFTDVSPSPKTITRYGDTKISTAQSVWGQGSGLFDGTGDYLTVPSSTDLQLSGDLTIEAWVYRSVLDAGNFRTIATKRPNTNPASEWGFYFATDGKIALFTYDGTNTNSVYSASSLSATTWYHIAAVRSGAALLLFIDGQLSNTATETYPMVANTSPLNIGNDPTNAARYFNGHLQDLRITKGVARYTADFAPPSGPLPARLPELPVQQAIIQPHSFHQIARLGL
jgi:hypothetical protein